MAKDQGHVEIERKYDASADFVLPDFDGLPDVAEVTDPRTSLLVATYFDTADLRLAARGITLRRRRGGSDAGWHLKIPVGPDAKRELHAPLGRAQIVPAKLANLVAAYTRGEPLRPIATLETSRTVVRLLNAEGEVLAEVADDAVAGQVIESEPVAAQPVAALSTPVAPTIVTPTIVTPADAAVGASGDGDGGGDGGPADPAGTREQGLERILERATEQAVERSVERAVAQTGDIPPQDTVISAWREIEVELVTGGTVLLKAVGKRLRKAGAGKADSASKLGRLLGGAVREAPVYEATGGTTAETVLAYLAAQRDAILTHDPKARLAEPDAVHKTRVAVRRTRSTLKSFAAVLDRSRTDPLQPELKWLADALGEVRDLEVLRMRFTDRMERLPEETPAVAAAPRGWLETLGRQEQSAYRRLNQALKEPRYFALLDALDALIADPPLTGRAARAGSGTEILVDAQGGHGGQEKATESGKAGKTATSDKNSKSSNKGKSDKSGKGKPGGDGKKGKKGKKGKQGGVTAADELPALVDAAWRRVEKAYAAVDGADDVEAARHETRKAAKRARYAAEAAKPVLGARAAELAANGEHVQEVLGGYQDGVIAMEYLRSIADRIGNAREAFVVGVLYGIEHAESQAARAEVEESWRRASTLADL